MRPLRRFFATLSLLSLVQLMLLASGAPCAMASDGASHGRMASAGMSGMSDHSAHAHCDVSGTGDDCGLPWSAGQCAGMATCVPTVVSPVAVVVHALAQHGASALSEPWRIASSTAAAPELPPPRA